MGQWYLGIQITIRDMICSTYPTWENQYSLNNLAVSDFYAKEK